MYQIPTNRPVTTGDRLAALPVNPASVELPTLIPTEPSVPTRLSGFDFAAEHYNNLLRQMRFGEYSLSDPLAVNAVAQHVSKQVGQMPTILSQLSLPVDYSGTIALGDAFRNARDVEREVGIVYANEVLEELASKNASSVPDHVVQEIFQLINNAPLSPEQLPRFRELLNRDLEQLRAQKRALPHTPSRSKMPKPVIDFYKGLARIATDTNAALQGTERQAISDAIDGIRRVRAQFQNADLVFTRDLHRAIQETNKAAPILKNIFGYGTGEPLGGVLQGRALVRYLTNLESQLKQVLNNSANRQVAAANALARTPGPSGNDIEASIPTNSAAHKARRVAIGYLRFLPFMQTALENPQSAPEVAKLFLISTPDGKKRLPTLPEYAQVLQQQHAQIAQQVKRLVPLLRNELTIIREAMRKAPNQTLFQKFTRTALTGNELDETLNVLFDALDRLEENPTDGQAFTVLYRYLEPMLQGAEMRTGRDTRWLQYILPVGGATLQAFANSIDALKNNIGLGFLGNLGNITGRGRTAPFMFLAGREIPSDVANRFVDAFGQLVFYRTLLNQAMPVFPNPIDRAMGEMGMDPRIPRNAARIAFATTTPGAVYDVFSSFRGAEAGEPSVVMTGLGAAIDTGMISPSNALAHWMYPYLNAVGLAHRSPLGVSQPTDIYPVPRVSMQAHPSIANFVGWSMANPTTGFGELVTAILAAVSGIGLTAKAAQWSVQATRAIRGIALGSRVARNATHAVEGASVLQRMSATLSAANAASRASRLSAAHRIALALGSNAWGLANALGDRGDITEFVENIPADSTAERVFRAITDPNFYLTMFGQGAVIAPFTQSYQSLRRAYQYFKPSVRNTAEYLIGYTGNYLDEVQRYYAPDGASAVATLQASMELPTQRTTGYVGLRRAGGIAWLPIKQVNTTHGISGEPSVVFVAVDENGQDVLVDPSDLNALIVPKTPVANAGAYSQIVLARALATGNLSLPDAYWHAMLGDVNALALKQMQVLTPTANGEYQLNPQLYQALRQNIFASNMTPFDEQLALSLAARDAGLSAVDRTDYEQQLIELYRTNRERLQNARTNERMALRFEYLADLLDGLDTNTASAMVYDALLERVQQNMPTAGAFRVMNEDGELVPVAGTVYAVPISQLNALGVGGEAVLNLLATAPDVDFYVDANGNAYVGIDGRAALEYLRDPEQLARVRSELSQIGSAFYANVPAEMALALNAPISGLYDIAAMLDVPLAVQPNLNVMPTATDASSITAHPSLGTEPSVAQTVEPQPADESFVRTVADILRERSQAAEPTVEEAVAEVPTAEVDAEVVADGTAEAEYDFTAEPQRTSQREKRVARPRERKRREPVIRFQAIEREERQPIEKRQVINALKELSQLIIPGGVSGLKAAREIRAIYRQYRLRHRTDSLVRTAVSNLPETLRHMSQNPREIDALALRILTQRLDHVLDKLNASGAQREQIRDAIVQIFETEIERYHHRVRTGPMFLTGRTKNIQSLIGHNTEYLQSEIKRSSQSIEKYFKNYVILFEIFKLDLSKLDKRRLMDVVFEIRERAREIQTFDDFIEYWSSEENFQYREAYARYLESRLEEFQREYDDLGANYSYYIQLLRNTRPQEGLMSFFRWALSNMGYDRELLATAAILDDIEVDDEMHKEILRRMRSELTRLVDVRDYEREIDLTSEELARSDAILWFVAREFAQKWITNQIAPDREVTGIGGVREIESSRDEYALRVARALFYGPEKNDAQLLGAIFARMVGDSPEVYDRKIDAPQHILDWVQSKIEYYRDEKVIAYTETDVYKRDFFAYISSRIAGRVPVVAANAFLEELWHALVFRLQVMDIPRELLFVLEPLVYDMGGTITQTSARELLKKWTAGVRGSAIMRGIPIPDEPVDEEVFARIREQAEAYEEEAVAAALESLLGEIVRGSVIGGITKAEQLFLLDTFRYWLQRYGVALEEALEHPNLVKWFETFLILAYKRNEDEMYLADILRERMLFEDEELPEITTIFPPRPLENAIEQLDKLYHKVYESGHGIWFRDIDSLFGTTPTGRFQAFDRIVGRHHVGFENVVDWLEHHSEAVRGNVRPPRGYEPLSSGRWQSIPDEQDFGYLGRAMPFVALTARGGTKLPTSRAIQALLARITPNLLRDPETMARYLQEAAELGVNPLEHGTWHIYRDNEDGVTRLRHTLLVDGTVVAEAEYWIERRGSASAPTPTAAEEETTVVLPTEHKLELTRDERTQIRVVLSLKDRRTRRQMNHLLRRLYRGVEQLSRKDLQRLHDLIRFLEEHTNILSTLAHAMRRDAEQQLAHVAKEEREKFLGLIELATTQPFTDEQKQFIESVLDKIPDDIVKNYLRTTIFPVNERSLITREVMRKLSQLDAELLQAKEIRDFIQRTVKQKDVIRRTVAVDDLYQITAIYTPRYRDVLHSGIVRRADEQPRVLVSRQTPQALVPTELSTSAPIRENYTDHYDLAHEYARVILPGLVVARNGYNVVNIGNNITTNARRRGNPIREFVGTIYTLYPEIATRLFGADAPSVQDFIAQLESGTIQFGRFLFNVDLHGAYGARYVTVGELITLTYDRDGETVTDVYFINGFNSQLTHIATHAANAALRTVDNIGLQHAIDAVANYTHLFYLAADAPSGVEARPYRGRLNAVEFRALKDGTVGLHLGENAYYPVRTFQLRPSSFRTSDTVRDAIEAVGNALNINVYEARYAHEVDWSDMALHPRFLDASLLVSTVWNRAAVEGMQPLGLGVYENNGRYYIYQPEAVMKLRTLQKLFASYMSDDVGAHNRAVSAVLSSMSFINYRRTSGGQVSNAVTRFLSSLAKDNLQNRIQRLDIEVLSGLDAIVDLYQKLNASWMDDPIADSFLRTVNRVYLGQEYELAAPERAALLARQLDDAFRDHPVWDEIRHLSEDERGTLYRFLLTEPEFAHRYFGLASQLQMLLKREMYVPRKAAPIGSEKIYRYLDRDFLFGVAQTVRNGTRITVPNSYVFLTVQSNKLADSEQPTKLEYEEMHRSIQSYMLVVVVDNGSDVEEITVELRDEELAQLFMTGEFAIRDDLIVRTSVSLPAMLDYALTRMRGYAIRTDTESIAISDIPSQMTELYATENGVAIRVNPVMHELNDLSYAVQQFLGQYRNDRRKRRFNLETQRMFLELLNAVSSFAHSFGVYEPREIHRYLERAGFVENAPAYRLMHNLLTMFVGSLRNRITLRSLALAQGMFYDLVDYLVNAESSADIERVLRMFEDVYGTLRPQHPLGAWYGTYAIEYAVLDPDAADPDRKHWRRETYRLVDLFDDKWIEEIWYKIPEEEKRRYSERYGVELEIDRFGDFGGFMSIDASSRRRAAENLIHTLGIIEMIEEFLSTGSSIKLHVEKDGTKVPVVIDYDLLKHIDEIDKLPDTGDRVSLIGVDITGGSPRDVSYESLNAHQRFKAFRWALERMTSYTGRDEDAATFSTSFWSAIISMYLGKGRWIDEHLLPSTRREIAEKIRQRLELEHQFMTKRYQQWQKYIDELESQTPDEEKIRELEVILGWPNRYEVERMKRFLKRGGDAFKIPSIEEIEQKLSSEPWFLPFPVPFVDPELFGQIYVAISDYRKQRPVEEFADVAQQLLMQLEEFGHILDIAGEPQKIQKFKAVVSSEDARPFVTARTVRIAASVPLVHDALSTAYRQYLTQTGQDASAVPMDVFVIGVLDTLRNLASNDPTAYRAVEDGIERALHGARGVIADTRTLGTQGSSAYPILSAIANAVIAANPNYVPLKQRNATLNEQTIETIVRDMVRTLQTEWAAAVETARKSMEIPDSMLEAHAVEYGLGQVLLGLLFVNGNLDGVGYIQTTRDEYLRLAQAETTPFEKTLHAPISALVVAALSRDLAQLYTRSSREWLETVTAAYMLPEFQRAVLDMEPTEPALVVFQKLMGFESQKFAQAYPPLSEQIRLLADTFEASSTPIPIQVPLDRLPAIDRAIAQVEQTLNIVVNRASDRQQSDRERLNALADGVQAVLDALAVYLETADRVGNLDRAAHQQLVTDLNTLRTNPPANDQQYYLDLYNLADSLHAKVSPGSLPLLRRPTTLLTNDILTLANALYDKFYLNLFKPHLAFMARRATGALGIEFVDAQEQEATRKPNVRKLYLDRKMGIRAAFVAGGYYDVLTEQERAVYNASRYALARFLAAVARNENGIYDRLNRMSVPQTSMRDVLAEVEAVLPQNEHTQHAAANVAMLLKIMAINAGVQYYGELFNRNNAAYVLPMFGIDAAAISRMPSLDDAATTLHEQFTEAIQKRRMPGDTQQPALPTEVIERIRANFTKAAPNNWRRIADILEMLELEPEQERAVITALAGAFRYHATHGDALGRLRENIHVVFNQMTISETQNALALEMGTLVALLVDAGDIAQELRRDVPLEQIGIYSLGNAMRSYRSVGTMFYPRVVRQLGTLQSDIEPIKPIVTAITESLNRSLLSRERFQEAVDAALNLQRILQTRTGEQAVNRQDQIRTAEEKVLFAIFREAIDAVLDQQPPIQTRTGRQVARKSDAERHAYYLALNRFLPNIARIVRATDDLETVLPFIVFSIVYDAEFADAKRAAQLYHDTIGIFDRGRNRVPQDLAQALTLRTIYFTMHELPITWTAGFEQLRDMEAYHTFSRDFIIARERMLGALARFVDAGTRAYTGTWNPFMRDNTQPDARQALNDAAFSIVMSVGEMLWRAESTLNTAELRRVFERMNTIADAATEAAEHLENLVQTQSGRAPAQALAVAAMLAQQQPATDAQPPTADLSDLARAFLGIGVPLIGDTQYMNPSNYTQNLLETLFGEMPADVRASIQKLVEYLAQQIIQRRVDLGATLQDERSYGQQKRIRFAPWMRELLFDEFMQHTVRANQEQTLEETFSEARGTDGWLRRIWQTVRPNAGILDENDYRQLEPIVKPLVFWEHRAGQAVFRGLYPELAARQERTVFVPPRMYELLEELALHRITERYNPFGQITVPGVVMTIRQLMDDLYWSSRHSPQRLHDGDMFLANSSTIEMMLILNMFGLVPVIGSNKRAINVVFDPAKARENINKRFRNYLKMRYASFYYDYTPRGAGLSDQAIDQKIDQILEYHDKITQIITQILGTVTEFPSSAQITELTRGVVEFVKMMFASRQEAYIPTLLFTHEFAQLLYEIMRNPSVQRELAATPVDIAETQFIIDEIAKFLDLVYEVGRGTQLDRRHTELLHMAHMLSRPAENLMAQFRSADASDRYTRGKTRIQVVSSPTDSTITFMPAQPDATTQVTVTVSAETVRKKLARRYKRMLHELTPTIFKAMRRDKAEAFDVNRVVNWLDMLSKAVNRRKTQLTSSSMRNNSARLSRLDIAEDYIDAIREYIQKEQRVPDSNTIEQLFMRLPVRSVIAIVPKLLAARQAIREQKPFDTILTRKEALNAIRTAKLTSISYKTLYESLENITGTHLARIQAQLDEIYNALETLEQNIAMEQDALSADEIETIYSTINALKFSIPQQSLSAVLQVITKAVEKTIDSLSDSEIAQLAKTETKALLRSEELLELVHEIPLTVKLQHSGKTATKRYNNFRQIPIWQRGFAGRADLYLWLVEYARHLMDGKPSESYRQVPILMRTAFAELHDAMDERPLSLDRPIDDSKMTLGEQIEEPTLPEPGSVKTVLTPTRTSARKQVRRRTRRLTEETIDALVTYFIGNTRTALDEVLGLVTRQTRMGIAGVLANLERGDAVKRNTHRTFLNREFLESVIEHLFSQDQWIGTLDSIYQMEAHDIPKRTEEELKQIDFDKMIRRSAQSASQQVRSIRDKRARLVGMLMRMEPKMQAAIRQRIIARLKEQLPERALLEIQYGPKPNLPTRGRAVVRIFTTEEEIQSRLADYLEPSYAPDVREIIGIFKMLYTLFGDETLVEDKYYIISQNAREAFIQQFKFIAETQLHPYLVRNMASQLALANQTILRKVFSHDEAVKTSIKNGARELLKDTLWKHINRVADTARENNNALRAVLNQYLDSLVDVAFEDAIEYLRGTDIEDDDSGGGGTTGGGTRRGGGGGARRAPPPPQTRQYRPSRRETLFGLTEGGRFQAVRPVFSSRTGITITSDENLRALRTAVQLVRGLAGNQHNKALMDEETLIRLMYGDAGAIDHFLELIRTQLLPDASTREAHLRQLNNQALYALVRQITPHLGILGDMLYNIFTTVKHIDKVSDAIQAEVKKRFSNDRVAEHEAKLKRLLPFYHPTLANAVASRIAAMIPPTHDETEYQAYLMSTLMPILSVLNIAYILTHYSVLTDHRRNLPHETTFNTQARVPLYGERSYDGRTEATFITYAPILTEYQLLSEDEASATLTERYTRKYQVDLEKLWVHVPIGNDDSDHGIALPALSEPALVMAELYLELREREAQVNEPNQHRAEHGAGIELIRHQRELIGYARKADATQLPVWLYVGNEVTALAARIGGREWNRLRIGKTTMNLPISFMPRLREWLRRTKLDEFFMNFAPVNAPRSVPIRLSRIAAVIGRLLKTSVDLTGGGLISHAQNMLYNMFNREVWRAFGAGILFGWAPYASAGVVYRWYERLGRTRRGIDANATYHLLGLQFDAMREYTAGHAAQNSDWFQNTNFREAEHLPLVFSTSNKQLHELYLDLRNALEPIVGTEYADTAVELLLIRAHLDDDVWHERTELFYENLRRLVIGENARIRTEDQLYAYLGTDQLDDLETDDGTRIYAAQRYLDAIENNEIAFTRLQYKYWNSGTSMLFKLHNRFYTRLMREHGVTVREPIAALILMEHLLINATLSNYLQRVGIGSGVMRPEGLFAGTTVMDVGSEPAESDDASGYIYRGLGRQLWFIRKLYDAYLWTKSAITGMNALYNQLPASWRSLNAAVSLLMFGAYLAGSLNPFTMPLFFVSGFFTLSNFLSKIAWTSQVGFELQRDIRAYYTSVRPVGEVSMLVNTSDTNRLVRLFNEQLAIMRQANSAAAAGDAVGFRSAVQFPPDAIVQTAGATKMILETRGHDTQILLSEPHAIALLAMVQRPDLLPTYLEQLKALRDELPSVQELIDYVNAYTREFQTLGVSYTVEQRVLDYDGEQHTVYFLRVKREVDGEEQVRYYELSWFRENIDTVIARHERVLQKYERLMSDKYRQQIEAAEAVLMFLMERQRRLMDFPDAVLMSEPFEQLAQALEPIVDELVGTRLPLVHDAGFSKEVNTLRSALQRIMLYSARAEAALNELAYHDLETDIRNDAMLETLTSHEAYRETLEEARELAREYDARVLHPVRRYLLETFLVPVAYRNTILQIVRGTLPHFVLAPNVLISQLSVILGSIERVKQWLGLRSGSARPLGEYEQRLMERGHGARIATQLGYATLVLVFVLLSASAYCMSPTIQDAYDASGMDNIFEFECRSGRFAAMSVGIGDQKLTFRPAYTIDLATRYIYHILRLTRRPAVSDIETRTNTIPDVIAGLGRETLEWLSIRIPPLEQSAVEFATRGIRELGLAVAPGAFEFSAYETILQNEDAVLTGYHYMDDMLGMLTNNFTPMALENLREVLAASVGANMRAGFWHWFFNDEAIATRLTQKPRMSEPNRIYGYPLGLPDLKRAFQAAPYAASSASLRAVRPYNPLNQLHGDAPTLYALGYYTPKGAIESTVPLDGTTLAEATRSYSSRVDRNEDYNRILRALDPLIYSVLELQIVQPQTGTKKPYTLRDFLNDQDYKYSPLLGTPVEVRQLVSKLRAEHIMQPSRLIRRAMMLYEYLYLLEPQKLQHMSYYRKFAAERYAADPSTLNGIIRAGADYATAQYKRPFAMLFSDKPQAFGAYRGIQLYHLYATAELYRMLGMAIDPKYTESMLLKLSQAVRDPARRDVFSAAEAYSMFVSGMHSWITQAIQQQMQADGVAVNKANLRAYYERLLHHAVASNAYERSYSPSFHAGDLFALGMFLTEQDTAIREVISMHPRQLNTIATMFGERGTRRLD